MSQNLGWKFPGSVCANIEEEGATPRNCNNKAKLTCTRCHLVKYCSANCQKDNWPLHKTSCRSPLTKPEWVPIWEKEGRERAPLGEIKAKAPKYLFGNLPAIDVLKNTNRAVDESGDLDLCFAASGDIRNIVETVVNIPETFSKRVRILVNDLDDIVAVRSLMLLLVALNEDHLSAPETMLHLWYSAFLPAKVLTQVKESFQGSPARGLVEGGWQELLQMNWKTDTRSQSILTTADLILRLEKLLGTDRSPTECIAERQKKLLSTYGIDYRETELYPADPFQRVASTQFVGSGIVIPVGVPPTVFSEPNPLIFAPDCSYFLNVSSDPSHGWCQKQVKAFTVAKGLPKNDRYGCLHSFLLSKFETFCTRLRQLNIEFIITQEDCKDLPKILKSSEKSGLPRSFDCIEISNLCDMGYIGLGIFEILPPLLKPTSKNFTPVIIGVFMTAILDAVEYLETPAARDKRQEALLERVVEVMGIKWEDGMREETALYRMIFYAVQLYYPVQELFDLFRGKMMLESLEERGRVVMRDNKIVPEWPTGLKRGTREEEKAQIYEMASEGTRGWDRYVEWVKV